LSKHAGSERDGSDANKVETPKEIQSLKIKGFREIKANLNRIVKRSAVGTISGD
jgi:hypothetical protein